MNEQDEFGVSNSHILSAITGLTSMTAEIKGKIPFITSGLDEVKGRLKSLEELPVKVAALESRTGTLERRADGADITVGSLDTRLDAREQMRHLDDNELAAVRLLISNALSQPDVEKIRKMLADRDQHEVASDQTKREVIKGVASGGLLLGLGQAINLLIEHFRH